MTEQNDEALMGDEVYQPGDPDGREDEGVLDAEDTLSDLGVDPYDEGWSPRERPLGVDHTGNTAAEQRDGESLGERLAGERPDPVVEEYEELESEEEDGHGIGGDPLDGVGARRAGLLVEPDESAHEDAEKDMLVEDVVPGGEAAAPVEEAAVPVRDEVDPPR
ncbi:DUF5709 domain-containing protein [Streptomyces sp. T-3]|nr:DUF5709 domain-containing protein [Streptomyces sp. T-3]